MITKDQTKAVVHQGDLLSGQTETLSLAGETGVDYERLAKEKAAREAGAKEAQARRKRILGEIERGEIYPFEPGDYAAAYMPETLHMPAGWIVEDINPSQHGSVYWSVKDSAGRLWKLTVRDHPISDVRAAEFGRPDLAVYVKDTMNPSDLADGMTQLEEKLASKEQSHLLRWIGPAKMTVGCNPVNVGQPIAEVA